MRHNVDFIEAKVTNPILSDQAFSIDTAGRPTQCFNRAFTKSNSEPTSELSPVVGGMTLRLLTLTHECYKMRPVYDVSCLRAGLLTNYTHYHF